MKFNLSHYGCLYGDKDMIHAPDSHVVNGHEERRGACSYFVFYSKPAGNGFFFWWKDFMKDYRRLRSDHVFLHTTEIKFRDKLRHQLFCRAKGFAMRWGFHVIPANMRLAMDYAASELNEPALVWLEIPLARKRM